MVRRAVLALSSFVVACGGFLPIFGDDDPPPPDDTRSADASTDDAVVTADGASDPLDGSGATDATDERLPPGQCKPAKAACTIASECCTGHECRTTCCVPGGLYANAEDECCDGTGQFDGFRGWFCLDAS